MLPHKTYDLTVYGRFVNRPYEMTKVGGSIGDGGSKPPPYEKTVLFGRVTKQAMPEE